MKKVVCKNNYSIDYSNIIKNLTINKIYEVLEESVDNYMHFYKIIDDSGIESGYFKDRFIDLSIWRDLQINSILE